MRFLVILPVAWLVVHAAGVAVLGQIAAGQVDDFQQGGTQGWREGAASPNPPQVITTGGPAGAGDAFLRNLSSGSSFAGGKMTVFNTASRWAGNYLDAGITALEADLNNLGTMPLTIRFNLVRSNPMSNTEQVFTQGFEIQPGSGWQHATFSLAEDELFTSGDASAILGNVLQLRIVHDPRLTPRDPQPPVNGLLGIDNIRAVGPPIMEGIPGDYNGSGLVEQGDLDLVLGNWGGSDAPATWINGLPEGIIDQAELDGVLGNWGRTSPAAARGLVGGAVPEPATLLPAGILGLLSVFGRRRRTARAV